MKKGIRIILLITFSTITSFAQNLNVAKLDSFLNSLGSRGLALGSLTISQNGIVTYKKAIGYSLIDDQQKVLADITTKYRIGSVSKLFTATMIFQLVEEGKIKLDQKLETYFPHLPNAEKITIEHMLYHRSGLHDYTVGTNYSEWMDKPKTHVELLQIIQGKGSDFEPGAKADYCNSNYLLLSYIIEKVCNTSYADALKKRITAKLNLKNTYFGKPINVKDNESASYKYSNFKWVKEKETDLSIHSGAGSIVSTPTDMVKFVDALFSFKIISKSSLAKMQTMVDDYGMGMFPNKYGNKSSFGHNGRIEEFYAALWHFPGADLSFAYCTNGIQYPRTDIIERILKICFNERFNLPFTKVNDVHNDDLDKYLGKYSSNQIVVNCTKANSKLLLEAKGKVFEVEKIDDHYFRNAEYGYFEFYPDKGELQIKETDNVYRLKRTN